MPALSPTMTEGNIARWKVKEGDSFVAGDVLLEIETDKATMDVEAQDDGIVMKIMEGDGAKSVEVGTRIAVMAEPGDDISKLEIPAAVKKAATPKQPQKEETREKSEAASEAKKPKPARSGEKRKQKHPLLPSVHSLVKANGLDEAAVESIKPTGPNGRLLKGDVLAYLGSIKADGPAKISALFGKLSHLDLSNIKVAPKKEAPKQAKEVKAVPPPPPPEAEVSIPISLAKVIEVQKMIQSKLGTFLPLSTFIARATEVANDDLPLVARKPTADDLFDAVVLGLDTVPRTERGLYVPHVKVADLPAVRLTRVPPKTDIIDMLAAPPKKATSHPPSVVSGISTGVGTGSNMFSLVVPEAEERRAAVFLDRMKAILEKEPGRLVL
jgi:pyruvate/2-oxoglutarate dehydrogenase complex dihydrolipoamide acyltransferase (E2) component